MSVRKWLGKTVNGDYFGISITGTLVEVRETFAGEFGLIQTEHKDDITEAYWVSSNYIRLANKTMVTE